MVVGGQGGQGARVRVEICRAADQKPVAAVAKKHGVSDQTIYAWRQRYGTLEAADVKRLRQLEQESGRLKKMVADRDLEIDVPKEITRKNGTRPAAFESQLFDAPPRSKRNIF